MTTRSRASKTKAAKPVATEATEAAAATVAEQPTAAEAEAAVEEKGPPGTVAYEVTPRAGKRVAGHVAPVGAILWLTPAEADHALLEGTLKPKGKDLPAVFEKGMRSARRLAEEAAIVRSRGTLPAEAEADADADASPAQA